MTIQSAIEFATQKHEGQTRKFSGKPYVTHPINVSNIVHQYCLGNKNYETLMTSAILHDTLEDTETTFKEIESNFGKEVSNLVQELTNDNEELQAGKTEYMKKKFLKLSNNALILKLADRLDNMRDAPTTKMKDATIEIIQYLVDNKMLDFTCKRLCDEIMKICKG